VKDVASFRSKHRSDIWDHPKVTGYIDLGDFLEPTLARNDFRASSETRAVYAHLFEIEEILLSKIDEITQVSEDRHYRALEDSLNQALSELAKLDNMLHRDDPVPGGSTPAILDGTGRNLEDGIGNRDHGDGASGSGPGFGDTPGDGTGFGSEPGDQPGGDKGSRGLRPDDEYLDGTPPRGPSGR